MGWALGSSVLLRRYTPQASSRSHTVFTLSLELHSRDASEDTVVFSKLNMVWLTTVLLVLDTSACIAIAQQCTVLALNLCFITALTRGLKV